MRLPIFPLEGVVLFPGTVLPLHIFEPRYREMVGDALAGNLRIGIQTLAFEGGQDGHGRPRVEPIGCAGEIVEHEHLEDGRYEISLQGLYRYRIAGEPDSGRAYRIAEVVPTPVTPLADAAPGESPLRSLLVDAASRLALEVGRPEAALLPEGLGDEPLVNEILGRLGLDAQDRYRLLAMDHLEERYAWALAHISGITRRLDLLRPFRRKDVEPRWN